MKVNDFETWDEFVAHLDKHGVHVDAYRIEGTDIRIERRSKPDAPEVLWAIVEGRCCLNTDFQWEYEPNPSNRTDDFISRTRFKLMDALRLLEKRKQAREEKA